MKDNDKLHKVLRLRELWQQHSAQRLSDSQRAHSQALAQRQQLTDMTEEYRLLQQSGQGANNGQSGASLANFQRFFGQLHDACRVQDETLKKLDQALDIEQHQFGQAYRARRALESLLERRELAHKKQRDKRLAKLQPPGSGGLRLS